MTLSSAYLDAFLAVSQTLSFTKAAEKLHITQSALSQRILNLEKDLELTLFIRDRSGLRLTEPALKLVRYCQQKTNLEQEVLASLKASDPRSITGIIRIGGFSSIMPSIVIPALAELVEANKSISIHTITKEMTELLELMKRGEIDYIISDDRIQREELERISLGKEKNVLVQHKKYTNEDVYLDHDENDEITIKYLKQIKIKTKDLKRHYVDDVHGLIAGVKNKLGRAVLPQHLIKDHADFETINKNQILEIPIYLYHYSQPYYSKLHHKTVEALTTYFEKHLN